MQIEDFWEDCVKFEPLKSNNETEKKPKKRPKKESNVHSSVNLNLTNFKKINKYSKINEVKFLRNHKLLEKILTTEELKPLKKQKDIKKFIKLYNNHISYQKNVQNKINNLKSQLINSELSRCTFRPRHNLHMNSSYDKTYKKEYKNIYQRGMEYKDLSLQKTKELKYKLLQEQEKSEAFPFKPHIQPKNLKRILYKSNDWEKRANNFSNKTFLWRCMKARKESEKKKLVYSYSKYKNNNDENFIPNLKTIHRTISQKESYIYKQSLHTSLLSYQTNENDDFIMIK